jgi:hypothetical protein
MIAKDLVSGQTENPSRSWRARDFGADFDDSGPRDDDTEVPRGPRTTGVPLAAFPRKRVSERRGPRSGGRERPAHSGQLDLDRGVGWYVPPDLSGEFPGLVLVGGADKENFQRRTIARPSPSSLRASATAWRCEPSSTRTSHWALPSASASAVSASTSRWCSTWRSAAVCGIGMSGLSRCSSMGCQRCTADSAAMPCWASTSRAIRSASPAAAAVPAYRKICACPAPTPTSRPTWPRMSSSTWRSGACPACGWLTERVTRQSSSLPATALP